MTTGQTIRRFSILLSAPISLPVLRRFSGQNLLLPFYHSVSDERLPHLAHVLKTRNTRSFTHDLEFFLKHFHPVDAPELVRLVSEGQAITRPVFHLTFDDGLKEMVTTVAPLLRRYGIPATFFINTGFIGNREIFYRYKVSVLIDRLSGVSADSMKKISELLDSNGIGKGPLPNRLHSIDYSLKALPDELAAVMEVNFQDYLKEHEIYMNEKDIRELLNQGFTIGAHSIDHPEFRILSREEQLRQTKESIKYLMGTFTVSPVLFSFPFSDEGVSPDYFTRIHKPGGPVDLSFGISGMKTDSVTRHLHRIPMEAGNCSARQIIKGEYLYYWLKALVHKNKINRK